MSSVSVMSAEMMCPSMWLTGMMGMSQRSAIARVKLTPTQSAGANPGPWVTANASTVSRRVCAKCCSMAVSMSGSRAHICLMVFVIFVDGSGCSSAVVVRSSLVRVGSIFWCSRFAMDGYTPP